MSLVGIDLEAFEALQRDVKETKDCVMNLSKGMLVPQRYHTVDETLEIIRVSKRTLQKYRDEGKISFKQMDSKIIFSDTDINEFMSRHQVRSYNNN